MYYKISAGTKTFDNLMVLFERIQQARKQARDLSKELGGTGNYCHNRNKLAGGISAIEFTKNPGKSWKKVIITSPSLFIPKLDHYGKKIWEKINQLVTIEYDDLNSIVGFNGPQTIGDDRGLVWVSTVIILWGKPFILMEVIRGCEFTPNDDMTEIIESEYDELSAKLKEKKLSFNLP